MSEETPGGPMATHDDGTGPRIPGVLLRGEDGLLYFIPHNHLPAFRVPESGNDLMGERLPTGAALVHTSIPAHWPMMPLCAFGANDDAVSEA